MDLLIYYLFIRVYMSVHCPYAHEGQTWALRVLLNHSSPYLLGQSLSLNLEFVNLTRLAGPRTLVICLSPPTRTGVTSVCQHTGFYVGAGGPNSELHTVQACTYTLNNLSSTEK